MFNSAFVTFPCCFLGQMWYLIVLIPDLCCLSFFDEGIVIFTNTKQEHLLKIVCPLIRLVGYPQSLTNANILGQVNLNMVNKSQGICGNSIIEVRKKSKIRNQHNQIQHPT